jgi:hypothetical protein
MVDDPRPTRAEAERILGYDTEPRDGRRAIILNHIDRFDRAGFIRPEPREPGFYYVRHRSFDWTIRHWHNERWWHGGDAADEPAEIGDRIAMPDDDQTQEGDVSKVLQLGAVIERHLKQIEKLLPAAYRLTLVARHTEMPAGKNADIIVSLDELPEVVVALERLIRGPVIDHTPHLSAPPQERRHD